MNSVKIVESFWDAVWKARNPDAARDLVVDDFVITTNDVDLVGKENFVAWIKSISRKDQRLSIRSNRDPFRTKMAAVWHRAGGLQAGTMVSLASNPIRSRSRLQELQSGLFAKMESF